MAKIWPTAQGIKGLRDINNFGFWIADFGLNLIENLKSQIGRGFDNVLRSVIIKENRE